MKINKIEYWRKVYIDQQQVDQQRLINYKSINSKSINKQQMIYNKLIRCQNIDQISTNRNQTYSNKVFSMAYLQHYFQLQPNDIVGGIYTQVSSPSKQRHQTHLISRTGKTVFKKTIHILQEKQELLARKVHNQYQNKNIEKMKNTLLIYGKSSFHMTNKIFENKSKNIKIGRKTLQRKVLLQKKYNYLLCQNLQTLMEAQSIQQCKASLRNDMMEKTQQPMITALKRTSRSLFTHSQNSFSNLNLHLNDLKYKPKKRSYKGSISTIDQYIKERYRTSECLRIKREKVN